ncbi:type II toxin-antitoxin system VapC family toxin [soil metagenome]
MRLLLDTSVLVAIARDETETLPARIAATIGSELNECYASAASLWEIAIKTRLGKLDPRLPLADLPDHFAEVRLKVLIIDYHHAIASLASEPNTRDPFDRLLLAQCQVEGLRLVTEDRALVSHPLAWPEA